MRSEGRGERWRVACGETCRRVEEEDQRRLHRELERVKNEETSSTAPASARLLKLRRGAPAEVNARAAGAGREYLERLERNRVSASGPGRKMVRQSRALGAGEGARGVQTGGCCRSEAIEAVSSEDDPLIQKIVGLSAAAWESAEGSAWQRW